MEAASELAASLGRHEEAKRWNEEALAFHESLLVSLRKVIEKHQLAYIPGSVEWADFDPAAVSWQSLVAVLYLITFGSIIALNCYLWLLTRVSAQKVTTYALVNPVVALVLGALVLNERVTLLAVAAAVLVLVGVALVLFQNLNPIRLLRERRERAEVGDARQP